MYELIVYRSTTGEVVHMQTSDDRDELVDEGREWCCEGAYEYSINQVG